MKTLVKLNCLFLILIFTAVTASCAQINSRIIKSKIAGSGRISDRHLGEVSGIAVSRINEDTLWVINDSGNSASVYALNSKGEVLGIIDVKDVRCF